jgi:hypothetical protein
MTCFHVCRVLQLEPPSYGIDPPELSACCGMAAITLKSCTAGNTHRFALTSGQTHCVAGSGVYGRHLTYRDGFYVVRMRPASRTGCTTLRQVVSEAGHRLDPLVPILRASHTPLGPREAAKQSCIAGGGNQRSPRRSHCRG